jgi:hypothetical protein
VTNSERSLDGDTSTAVHLSLQGKGGVGKSLASSILAQYLIQKGLKVVCVDTDPVNQTLTQYARLAASHLKLLKDCRIDARAFDGLMERLLTEDGVFVVDMARARSSRSGHYIMEDDVVAVLREAGRRLSVHCVITGPRSGAAPAPAPAGRSHARPLPRCWQPA